MKPNILIQLVIRKWFVLPIIVLLVTMATKLSESVTQMPFSAYNDISGDSQDIELRVAVEAGRLECFYQDVKLNHNLDLSYQVIEISSRFNWLYSGSNDLTIDFIVKAPNGLEIFRESRRKEGQHVYKAVNITPFTGFSPN